jgi:hypothetical protein
LKSIDYRNTHITEVNSFEEFKQVLELKEVLYQPIGMELSYRRKDQRLQKQPLDAFL